MADNFDPSAQYDNGSCSFDDFDYLPPNYQYSWGCTDPASPNYQPTAQIDNGTCIYLGGCMQPMADNFDPSAQYDNGSCVFSG